MRVSRITGAVWIPLALVVAACGATRPVDDCPAPRAPGQEAYAIGPADVLQVTVWQNADLTSRVVVRPDGVITLPLVGEVPVAGRRPPEVQEELTRRLARFLTTTASVTVAVLEVNSYRVYVLGQVTTPGELRPRGRVKVLQALALAGGLTRFGDGDHIVVVRHHARGQCRKPFGVSDVVEQGRLEDNFELDSGDTVFVP